MGRLPADSASFSGRGCYCGKACGSPPILFALGIFLSFRFFDIIKLPPARQLEKLPHGWGVLSMT